MTPLKDPELQEMYFAFRQSLLSYLWSGQLEAVSSRMNVVIERYIALRKEYEAASGMLADLQSHSNLYHKGFDDGNRMAKERAMQSMTPVLEELNRHPNLYSPIALLMDDLLLAIAEHQTPKG